jgi:hypothetical protein
MDWTNLTEDREQRLYLVNTIKGPPWKTEECLDQLGDSQLPKKELEGRTQERVTS